MTSQIETGSPYLLYKDACNEKSNQKNLGTIKSSNLCTEIIEFSNQDETAVCNLASIALPKYVLNPEIGDANFIMISKPDCPYCLLAKDWFNQNKISVEILDQSEASEMIQKVKTSENKETITFPIILKNEEYIGGYTDLLQKYPYRVDIEGLVNIAGDLTKNLNKVIDRSFYPTPETRNSNLRHRPIGIGVQGLSDMFMKMRLPFDSPGAQKVNKEVFEAIYYGAAKASIDLAEKRKIWVNEAIEAGSMDFLMKQDKYPNLPPKLRFIKEEYKLLLPENKEYCGAYSSFIGSPAWEGKFQLDLWEQPMELNPALDWDLLRKRLKEHGMRNSLL